MQITVLGSGTLLSGKERNPAAYLLSVKAQQALLDCGPGCIHQLHLLKTDLLQITTIFLSHFHLDHCSDVLPLLLARYLQKNDSNPGLTIVGPAGLQSWFNARRALQGAWLNAALPKIIEISPAGLDWAGLRVTAHPALHSKPSIAYRFSGHSHFFYSGDTDFYEPLINFAQDADLGLVESSFPDEQKIKGHLSASESGSFATRAGIKKLVLTHIYPANDRQDLAERVSRYFTGEIIVAQDFMKINLV